MAAARGARRCAPAATSRSIATSSRRSSATARPGLIGEREAEAARVEVSRRLLAAADAAASGAVADGSGWPAGGGAAALAALMLLPLGAAGLYLTLGSPQLAERSRRPARLDAPPEQRSIATLVGQVEAHLEQNPEDGRGWEVLAPVYMRLGRYDDAVKARRNALRLLGATAEREADLGEALTGGRQRRRHRRRQGGVRARARARSERLQGALFLGLAAEQDGRPRRPPTSGASCWRARRRMRRGRASCASRWRASIRTRRAAPGPTRGRRRGGEPAVARAARRDGARHGGRGWRSGFKQDGSDVDGWLRLLRAYMVLGDRDKARAAAGDARRALASDPDKLRRVDELAKGLGLEG